MPHCADDFPTGAARIDDGIEKLREILTGRAQSFSMPGVNRFEAGFIPQPAQSSLKLVQRIHRRSSLNAAVVVVSCRRGPS